jgi:hypothetical protein
MVSSGNMRYGPHTQQVDQLLGWFDRGELLQFRQPLRGPFLAVPSLAEAWVIAQNRQPGQIDWTEIREREEASLDESGWLNSPQWSRYKDEIEGLLIVVSEKVEAQLSPEYRVIIDDVIADLRDCAVCLALHGRLDSFHGRLWEGYALGGWPCGCTGKEPEPPDYELSLDNRLFYLLWKPNMTGPTGSRP